MDVKIASSWKQVLTKEFLEPYFKELVLFVKQEYTNFDVFPKPKDIFKAFVQKILDY